MDCQMKMGRRCGAWMAVAVVAAVLVAAWVFVQTSPSMLLPRMLIDRFNPLAPARTVYVAVPDAEDYAGSYEDATGAYDNYIYVVEGATEAGEPCELGLISFNGPLKAEGYLKVAAKGFAAERYAPVDAGDVPAPALEAME